MYKVGKVSCDTISQARTRGFGLEVMQPKPMWVQLGKSHCEPYQTNHFGNFQIYKNIQVPYARYYKLRFVYFYPIFYWNSYIFGPTHIIKSNFKSRADYNGQIYKEDFCRMWPSQIILTLKKSTQCKK
jgi:hypothetical protein